MRLRTIYYGFVMAIVIGIGGFVMVPHSEAASSSCTSQVLRNGSRGSCVTYAQNLLIKNGYTVGRSGADGVFGTGTTNATLNFQRAQKIYDDAVIGPGTWSRLLSPQSVSSALPSACKTSGVVICANQATRTLSYVKNGTVIKTMSVRFGGWAKGSDGVWRIYRTAKGTFDVYAKDADAWSYSYKVRMPYSLKFNGGQYIHYSADFDSVGYTGASHGCINVGDKSAAEWLYKNTPTHTKVYVY